MLPCMNYISTKLNDNEFNNKNKTVLFLHGWGGSTNSFLYVQKQLSTNYNTINVDFLGFGKSSQPDVAYDTFLYALSIYELLVKLNVNQVSIVAHSFGGRVAILLASVFNIKVENLILISSAGIKPKRRFMYHVKVKAYKFFKFLVKKKLLKPDILKFFGSKDYKQLNVIMKQTFINVVNQDLKVFLPYIKSNTLIVWGSKDKVTPLHFAKVFHKNILHSRLLVYKKASHFCYLENLLEFCCTVKLFLENNAVS